MKKRLILLICLPVGAAALALGRWGDVRLADLAVLSLEPVAGLLVTLLFSRQLERGRQPQQDNDLFI